MKNNNLKYYHGETDCVTLRCSLEEWVKSRKCFVMIHDGSTAPGGQNHRAAFTRKYALVWNGRIQPYTIKFYYDYREDLADFTIDDVTRQVMNQLNKLNAKIESPPQDMSFWGKIKFAFSNNGQPDIKLWDVITYGFKLKPKVTPKTKEQQEEEVVGNIIEAKNNVNVKEVATAEKLD